MRRTYLAVGLVAVVSLAGCGGSGGDPWLTEGQRAEYGEDEIQRDESTADELRSRTRLQQSPR